MLAICDFHREAYAEFWTRYVELVSQTIERRCELFYDPWEEYADMDYVDDHYRMNDCARDALYYGVSMTSKCRLMGIPDNYSEWIEEIPADRVYDVSDALFDALNCLGLGMDDALGLHSIRFVFIATVLRRSLTSPL